MDLARRDQTIARMESEKEEREEMLLDKLCKLRQVQEDNDMLKDVVQEYQKYFVELRNKKIGQKAALQTISEYIDELVEEGDTTKEVIRDGKYHQKAVLKEMRKLNQEIEKISRNID
jgi:predicted transcriptional regulator